MRSWTYVTQIAEPGRQLDNANLLQLASGDILLAMRSLVPVNATSLPPVIKAVP